MANLLAKLLRKSTEEFASLPSGGRRAVVPFESVSDIEAPFEIVAVPGAFAQQAWRELNLRAGVVPVLLGERRAMEAMLHDIALQEEDSEAILAAGCELDVDAWLAQRAAQDPDFYDYDNSMTEGARGTPLFSPARDVLTNKPHGKVFYALVPVAQSWQVPAVLKAGDWSECPGPAEHVAMFKRWDERYGARIVSFAFVTIEFVVARPPATMQEAETLAREQFLYCPDIVHQGVGTGGNLANLLLDAGSWYFWWD